MRNLRLLLGLFLTVLSLTACGGGSQSQTETQADAQFTVGIINIAAILNPVIDGIRDGMAELGYTEGQNVTYLYDGLVTTDAIPDLVAAFEEQGVDVIVVLTTPAAVAVRQATAETRTPVVFVPVNDPITAGIVDDLVEPGGNITGIISGQSEDRRLEWLLTFAPDAQRIYYPYNPDDLSPSRTLAFLQAEVAPRFNVELVPVEAPDEDAVRQAIENIPDDIDAIYLPSDARVGALLTEWVAMAQERGLPLSGSSLAHVEAGALCSYSYSPYESGKQSARLVDQILQGTDPGTLPIETAEPLFSVNLLAAQAIGFDVSEDILIQANIIVRAGEEG